MKLEDNLVVNTFKSVEGIFDSFLPSEDKADFLNLQGKLEPLTLRMSLVFQSSWFLIIVHHTTLMVFLAWNKR